MATEYPEEAHEVMFRIPGSVWMESLQRVVEFNTVYWSSGKVTWEQVEKRWWERDV